MLARTLLAVVLALSASIAFAEETKKIDATALQQRLDASDASVVVLDVRTPEEYAAGHVKGAINLPYTHLPARISEVQGVADKDVVLYCETGVRSERAASRLREHGFTRLLHLDGDMKKWRESGKPVEKLGMR